MNAGTIDNWETGIFFVEGQCKIGPAKHDCLGAGRMEQPFADRVEDLALRLCHNAGRRRLNVSLVDSIQVLTNWRDDLGVRHGSVETGLHDGASSEYANSSQAKLLDGPADFRNHVDHWQRRRGLEVGDAEVTGNGCDRDTS